LLADIAPTSEERLVAPTHEAADLLVLLESLPETPAWQRRCKLLGLIASRWYKQGECFARQETMAAAVRAAKSTVQLDLDALELEGFITRQRRAGTSMLTYLAAGLLDALRIFRLRRRTNKPVVRKQVEIRSVPRVRTAEVATISDQPSTQLVTPITTLNRPKAVVSQQPTPHSSSLSHDKALYKTSSLYTETKSDRDDDVEKKIATILTEEGITPARARQLAHLFDADRIERNVQLGLHRSATNPGGYLSFIIQHDVAAQSNPPSSEAALVRKRECYSNRPASPSDHETFAASKQPAIKPEEPMMLDEITQKFEALALEEQRLYESVALQDLTTRLPWISEDATKGRLSTVAMIRGAALRAFREKTVISISP